MRHVPRRVLLPSLLAITFLVSFVRLRAQEDAPTADRLPPVGLFGSKLEVDDRGRVMVVEVSPDTPASKAGLQAGDVILAIEGRVFNSLTELVDFGSRLVRGKKPGERVSVRIVRNQKEQPLIIELTEDTLPARPANGAAEVAAPLPIVLGIAVKERGPKVIVTQVVPNEPAARAGVRPGDVLLNVGRQQITSYATLASAIKPFVPGDKVPIEVVRDNRPGVLTVVVGEQTGGNDVVLDATEDVAQIVAEVKRLRAEVDQLTLMVQSLRREVAALRKR